jgi:hypothetical protein
LKEVREMAVDGVKQGSMAVVLQQAQRKREMEIAQPQTLQNEDRVTLNSRQNELQGTNNQQQRNMAVGVPGESRRPAVTEVNNAGQGNNNIAAQQTVESAKKTASMQQANNAYNPNKPTQTQNQINYTV